MGVLSSSLHGCSSRVLHLTHWNRKGDVSVDITRPWSSPVLPISPSLSPLHLFFSPILDRIFIYGRDLGWSVLGIHPYDFVVKKKIDFPFPAPMWKFPEKGCAGPCGPLVHMWTRGLGYYDWPDLSPGWGWVHLLPEKPGGGGTPGEITVNWVYHNGWSDNALCNALFLSHFNSSLE